MKTVIIALPVEDDADIFEIQDVINEAFPSGGEDSRDCVVYEGVAALMDDLGLETKETPEGGDEDQPARPTTTCGCGFELIWVEGHWQHDAAPYLWGDDHNPHPSDGDPTGEAREYWDLEDGVTYAWRVVYQIRSLIDPGPNSVVGEDFVRVVAEDEDEAKAKAEKWVRENDTLYDDRIQPSLSILNIYEVD